MVCYRMTWIASVIGSDWIDFRREKTWEGVQTKAQWMMMMIIIIIIIIIIILSSSSWPLFPCWQPTLAGMLLLEPQNGHGWPRLPDTWLSSPIRTEVLPAPEQQLVQEDLPRHAQVLEGRDPKKNWVGKDIPGLGKIPKKWVICAKFRTFYVGKIMINHDSQPF